MQPFVFPAVLRRLLTQAESLDDGTIAVDVATLEVVEQGATLTYEASKSTFGAVVLAVLLHVLGQVLNAIGEQSDLAFCATCVGLALAVLTKDLFFLS